MVEKLYEKMGSIQEINETAEQLRRIRLFDEVKKLAEKYQVSDLDLSEFLSGKRHFLVDGGDTQKDYETARSKVLDEMFALKDPQFADVIGDYILKCCEDSIYANFVLQKHKTLQRCIESLMGRTYDMVSDEVKKNSRYAGKAIGGDMVFDWVDSYYMEDDRDRVAEQTKKAEEDFKKRLELQKKGAPSKNKVKTSKKRSSASKTKQSGANGTTAGKEGQSSCVKTVTAEQEKGQIEGQVSLFESGLAG